MIGSVKMCGARSSVGCVKRWRKVRWQRQNEPRPSAPGAALEQLTNGLIGSRGLAVYTILPTFFN